MRLSGAFLYAIIFMPTWSCKIRPFDPDRMAGRVSQAGQVPGNQDDLRHLSFPCGLEPMMPATGEI